MNYKPEENDVEIKVRTSHKIWGTTAFLLLVLFFSYMSFDSNDSLTFGSIMTYSMLILSSIGLVFILRVFIAHDVDAYITDSGIRSRHFDPSLIPWKDLQNPRIKTLKIRHPNGLTSTKICTLTFDCSAKEKYIKNTKKWTQIFHSGIFMESKDFDLVHLNGRQAVYRGEKINHELLLFRVRMKMCAAQKKAKQKNMATERPNSMMGW